MSSEKSPSDQLSNALADGLARIESVASTDELRALVASLTGKKGALAAVKSSLGKVADIDERKALGQQVNEAMEALQKAADARHAALRAGEFSSQIEADRVDMTELALAPSASRRRGRMHLVTQATERLEDVFIGLGFQIAEGPEVETDFYNFEALNMPPSHPARSMWDTLFIESDVEGSVVLRTHTSPVQIRVMQEWPPPIYAVMPGRVFRKETPDATHMPVFHQIEGLVIDRGITFADLAGTIESFTKAFLVRASPVDFVRRTSRLPNQVQSSTFGAPMVRGLNLAVVAWCIRMCFALGDLIPTSGAVLLSDSESTEWRKNVMGSTIYATCIQTMFVSRSSSHESSAVYSS